MSRFLDMKVKYMGVKGTVIKKTDKAVLFKIMEVSGVPVNEEKSYWFPLSQIPKRMTNPTSEGEDTMMVPEWLLKDKV